MEYAEDIPLLIYYVQYVNFVEFFEDYVKDSEILCIQPSYPSGVPWFIINRFVPPGHMIQ